MNERIAAAIHVAAPEWAALMEPSGRETRMRRVNYLYLAAMFAMAGAFGTSTMIFYAGSALWAVVSLGIFRFGFDTRPLARALAAIMALYFFSAVLLAFAHWGERENMIEVLMRLPFIFVFAVLARIALSTGRELIEALENGALAGAMLAALIAIFGLAAGTSRPFAFSGNANVFTLANALLFMICVFAARRRGGIQGLVFAAGAMTAAFSVIVGGSRPMVLAMALVVVVALRLLPAPALRLPRSPGAMAFLIVLALGLGAVGWNSGMDRIGAIAEDAGAPLQPASASGSLASRLVLWKCGVEIGSRHPLAGAGIAGARDFMRQCSVRDTGRELAFSHYHNMVVDGLAKGGLLQAIAALLTLLMPVWAAFRWAHPETAEGRTLSGYGKALIIGIAIVFGLSGSTGLFLGQDVHDALYLFMLVLAFQIIAAGNRKSKN